MKTKIYVYAVIAIIVIAFGVVVSKNRQAREAAIPTNGSPVVPTALVPVVPTQSAPVVKTAVPVKAAPTAPPKIAVHVSKGGSQVYYSTSTAMDMIKIYNPPMNTTVRSPLTVTGVARGTWFFEGSAPLLLVDMNGNIIAQSTIIAQNNWQTTDYIAYLAALPYPPQPSGSNGVMILKKDNPSGLSKNDAWVEVLVTF